SVRRPQGDYVRDGGDLTKEPVNVPNGCIVVLGRIGRGSVGDEYDVVIADEALARSRFNANVGSNTGQYDRAYSVGAQDGIEIGVMEGAVAVFGDDRLARQRADVAVEIAFPRSLGANLPPRIAALPRARRLFQPRI